jgi:hypothetical protein
VVLRLVAVYTSDNYSSFETMTEAISRPGNRKCGQKTSEGIVITDTDVKTRLSGAFDSSHILE